MEWYVLLGIGIMILGIWRAYKENEEARYQERRKEQMRHRKPSYKKKRRRRRR